MRVFQAKVTGYPAVNPGLQLQSIKLDVDHIFCESQSLAFDTAKDYPSVHHRQGDSVPKRNFDDPERLAGKIRELREALKLNQRQFSNRLGVSQANVSRWESGTLRPESQHLMKIAELAKDKPDSLYFMMAAGVPSGYFMGDQKYSAENLPSEIVSSVSPDPPAPVYQVPLLRDPAAAGTPRAMEEGEIESFIPFLKSWAPRGSALVAVRVRGDSMDPLVLDNYIVFVDTSQRDHKRLTGRMVLAHDSNGTTLKWLRNSGDIYMLVAQNTSPRFPITVLTQEDGWGIVGVVIMWIGEPPISKRK